MTHQAPHLARDPQRAARLQERFQYAFEHAAIAMALLSGEGAFLQVNDAYCGLTGHTAEELFASGVRHIIHPDDHATTVAAIGKMVSGSAESVTWEERYVKADGTIVWGLVTNRAIREDGELVAFFAQVQDISALKESERELQHSRERLRLLTHEAKDIVVFRFQVAPELRCELMSSAIFAMTGHEPREFYADPALLMRTVHEDDLPKLQASLADPAALSSIELRWRHADGRIVSTFGRVVPITDDAGTVTGLEGIAYDVTAQRNIEEQRLAEERRFRSLVQSSNDLIAIVDSNARVTYISPSVRNVLGREPDEMTGTNVFDLLHPDDVESSVAQFAADTSKPPDSVVPLETRLRHRDGTYRWVEIVTTNRTDDPAIGGLVVNARDVTERHVTEEQLRHHALHDRLTDLPNRALLLDRLTRALGRLTYRRGVVALLGLDMDGFSVVNANLGHDAGDEVLIQIAGRITGALPADTTVARFGGDEFVVSAEVASEADALELAQRLLSVFEAAPLHARDRDIHLTVSIGLVLAVRADESAEAMLRSAQIATRRAKTSGRARVEVFDDEMRERAQRRLDIETGLRDATLRDELRVFYQPVVSLAEGRIVGAEALVRWQRPGVGLVSPADFIPAAEETGLIVGIGAWVFEQACVRAREWEEQFGRPFSVSVNVSVRQLAEPTLLTELGAILERTGLAPNRIALEITESVLIEDNEYTLQALIALKALKLRLSLDDFGTRYSSLSYLRRYPFDILKVDQSFVRGMIDDARDREIVRGVIGLARSLGLRVVAEGVETQDQYDALKAMGADSAQGYLMARPLPEAEFESLLRENPAWR
jgi:diguanylate cyclase (GGDEF)-like protein/PAS domain S-box-containing protein